MDVYSMFFKLLVSTIVTFIEAAIMLLSPVAVDRAPARAPAAPNGPRLVRASTRVPAVPDARALIAQLTANDPAERTRAACALADMEAAAAPAVPALARLLGDAARVDARVCDGDRRGRRDGEGTTTPGEAAAAALASIGKPSVDVLIASLGAPEWFARKNAAWALGAIEDARAVSPVIAVLRDPEPAVRQNAAWALGALEAKAAVVPLTGALRDPDAETREKAAWALGAIEDPRAVDPLSRALSSDADHGVRAKAAWALGAIGEPRAADALAAALKDRDVEVRRHAAWALGAIQQ